MPGVKCSAGIVMDGSTFRKPPSELKIEEGKKLIAEGEKEYHEECNGYVRLPQTFMIGTVLLKPCPL